MIHWTKSKCSAAAIFGVAGLLVAAGPALADGPQQIIAIHTAQEHGIGGTEVRPQSSFNHREDAGKRAHTHFHILIPNQKLEPMRAGQQNSIYFYNNALNIPSSVACLYDLVPQPRSQAAGCNPQQTSVNPSGGGGAIALVDAYDSPTAASDIATFASSFGFPAPNFTVVYAGGSAPYISGSQPSSAISNGWYLETALDTQWAFAMAPKAKIFLVEAQSDGFGDLFTAVMAAEYLVSKNGGGEVSMSWGSTEFSAEAYWDQYFAPGVSPSNVVFVASAGDDSVVEYPAISPYVIGAGGTTINRNAGGVAESETAWSASGGGVSLYEPRPSFQNLNSVERLVGAHRGAPDVALVADPNTGVAIYANGGWWSIGGTSAAAPSIAGIINTADHAEGKFPYATTELQKIYRDDGTRSEFRDITSGSCGPDSARSGYDLCTGFGSLLTYSGK